MAYDEICVFCGAKLSAFRSSAISCGGVYQPCCKSCSNELKELNTEERCRRALRLGHALQPDKLKAKLEFIPKAEERRPSCLRCGAKMHFGQVQYLDNSPLRDSILHEGFGLLPAYCGSCGLYEFYNPDIALKDEYIAYLVDNVISG